MRRRNTGFTLIELLIVVAIIGVLASVGVPAYQGYIGDAKMKGTIEIHMRVKSFAAAAFTKCAGGATGVVLPGYNNDKPVSCSHNGDRWAKHFADYFNSAGFKNLYDSRERAVFYSKDSTPPMGRTCIFTWGNVNKLNIKTQHGTNTGAYTTVLVSSFVKE